MTSASGDRDNFCYRHPDRQSFVLCQRCGRTICPQCQTQAAVGVHCPECIKESRATAPRTKPAIVTALRSSGRPTVTWSLIAINVVVFLLQIIPNSPVESAGIYAPVYTPIEPWRMLTSVFLHASFLHIGLNMFSLYIFGPILEQLLGRGRFVALYLISGFGGSVAVLFLSDPYGGVLGASGAIFGLMGAFFVVQRRLGGNSTQLLVLIVINLAIGFIPGTNVAWQAHLGGLVAGAAIALVYVRTRRRDQKVIQIAGVAIVTVALIALTLVGVWRWA